MSIKCKLGLHEWNGCQCSVCGKFRDDHHDLSIDCEKCARCGQNVLGNHNWSKDCEKCSKCGKTRNNIHSWDKDCEKCSNCGTTRPSKHDMIRGLCIICGHGKFEDDLDGRTYEVVKIGNHILMSENYAKKPKQGDFWLYDNLEENKSKYGYLYDWETAGNIAPNGWHLPTKEELESVYQFLGGQTKQVYDQMKIGGNSGFECQFAGWRTTHGAFNGLGASAHFWCNTSDNETTAWQLKLNAYSHHAEFEKAENGQGLSVRLFKDQR